MLKKATIAGMSLAVVAGIALARIEVHTERQVLNGAQLMWTADEAYLFLGTSHMGWLRSYLGYVRELVRTYLYAVTPPRALKSSITVIRLTPTNVEQHVVDDVAQLGGQSVVLTTHVTPGPDRVKTIEVQRPGGSAERIWMVDERLHHVSRADYRKVFKYVHEMRPRYPALLPSVMCGLFI